MSRGGIIKANSFKKKRIPCRSFKSEEDGLLFVKGKEAASLLLSEKEGLASSA